MRCVVDLYPGNPLIVRSEIADPTDIGSSEDSRVTAGGFGGPESYRPGFGNAGNCGKSGARVNRVEETNVC